MGKKSGFYQYYVEGEDDRCIVNVLKSELGCIESGKVNVFNVVQERFNIARIRTLKDNTTIVLIYDTDTDNIEILKYNISFLKKQKAVKEIICIPQVNNLEDELVRSCDNINSAEQLTHSKSKKDYKRDIIKCSNLDTLLRNANFDLDKIWSIEPKNKFKEFGNDSKRIKLK